MKKDFADKILTFARAIPKGKVTTYGALAAAVSSPRSARVVGYLLRHLPSGTPVPWQRVVNARGMISIENLAIPKTEQTRRLQGEGVEVELRNGNYWVDLRKYFWNPTLTSLRGSARGRIRSNLVIGGKRLLR
ncbi:MAG: methylated-DNA-protein-cysteine methyltransferase [Parcubacteria group bacterium GW2011_GWA2_51_12]|nr:MAG: methylated-DNA-protein-cysteine methyltransferase [Parcubacteria group bacterium GW2011_GWA2_51_12]